MQLVVDTNIIIAALFKNAITRELLWEENFEFFAPEHIRVELEKLIKDPKFRKRLHVRDTELKNLIDLIFKNIIVLPESMYYVFNKKARRLVQHPHDIPFIALALALKIPLWSNDTELREQTSVIVYSTKELLEITH